MQVEKRGRIETDEVWESNILITGDVVIERDITVRVMAGTRIIFSDSRDKGMDCKRRLVKHFNRSHTEFEKIDFGFIDENAYSIVVRGSFLCNGTPAAGIRIGSRQWRGSIIVGSLRGSSGNFYAKNTAIKYAGIGLWGLKNTKIDFVDGEISSSTFGFVAGGEFNSIRGSNILKNNVGIVSLGSMEMHCSGNTVKNSRYYGILFGGSEYNSKVSIAGNKVISNDVGMHVAYAKNADINNNKIIRNRVGMYCRKSKNIKIDRNIIKKSNTNGLILDMETEHAVVSGNRFHNNGELAVECMSNAGAVIKDNKLSGESIGFCLRGKCRVTIEDNTIRGNQFPGSWGIRCSEMSRTAVINNVIEGFENAIKADDDAAADIRGNRIKTDNMGIDSGGESTVSFSANTVQSKTVGIYAHADSHIDVKNNKITSKIGIEIRDLCCVNFSENILFIGITGTRRNSRNGADTLDNRIKNTGANSLGIDLAGAKNNKLSGRSARVKDKCRVVIGDNTIKGDPVPYSWGVRCLGITEAQVLSNRIEDFANAIKVTGAVTADIRGNKIKAHNRGIDSGGESTVKFSGNTVQSKTVGIYAHTGSHIDIESNKISGMVGAEIKDSCHVYFKDNRLSGESIGFRSRDKCRSVIEGNSIKGDLVPDGLGIQCSEMSETEVLNNRIEGYVNAIEIIDTVVADIRGNKIKADNKGIASGGESRVKFSGNTVQSKTLGVYAHANSHIDVKSNKITSSVGVEIKDSSHVNLSENILSVGSLGVRCTDRVYVDILHNRVKSTGAGCMGIELAGDLQIKIKENSMLNITKGIVVVDDGVKAEITGNALNYEQCGIEIWGRCVGGEEWNSVPGKVVVETQKTQLVEMQKNRFNPLFREKDKKHKEKEPRVLILIPPVVYKRHPSIGVAYLLAYLRSKGCDIAAWDLNTEISGINDGDDGYWSQDSSGELFINENEGLFKEWVKKIIDYDPDIICFSVWSTSRKQCLKLAELIKKQSPEKIIVFGGYETVHADMMLRNENAIDILVKGEGERALYEIIKTYKKYGRVEFSRGSLILKNGYWINCGSCPEIEDLDTLPFPDYSDFRMEEYLFSGHIPISFSRGCRWRCSFCTVPNCWKKCRVRTAGNILEEIKLRLNQYEVAQFIVCDPAVNQDLGMLSDLCDMIIDEGLDIKWDGMAQISNDMGLDLLKKMERAGCVMLNYGVESGSEKVLRSMGKKYTPDEAEDVIKNTYAAGINVVMNMIVGYPNESEQDFNMTLEFVERVRPYVFNIAPGHPCLVVPYNRLFTHPGKYGIIFDEDSPSLWQTANGSNDGILREERAGIFDRFLDDLDIPIRCGDDDRELLEKDRKDGND